MTRATFPGGLYSISLPDGSRIVEYPDRIEVNGTRIPRPGRGLLAMVARKFHGFIYIAGQENEWGTCWLYTPTGWQAIGPTHGVRPCAFGDDSLFIAIAGDRYARVQLNGGVTSVHPLQIGSQGIRYVNGDVPVPGDATIFDGTVHEFIDRGDVRAGQGHEDGCLVNGRLLEPGNCQFINFERDGYSLAVAIVKFLEGQSVLYWFNRAEVEWLPLPGVPVPPVDPPPVDPVDPIDPVEPPMSVPNRAAELHTFHQLLWNSGQPITDEAEKHRFTAAFAGYLNSIDGTGRWGRKSRAGAGQPVSKDTLGYWLGSPVPTAETDGKQHVFDVIASSGAVGWDLRAEQNDPGYFNIDARWYPVSVVPEDPPDDPPIPDPVPAQIAALTERLEAVAAAAAVNLARVEERVLEHDHAIEALETAPAPVMTLPKLRVRGSTGRAFGHGHAIDLPVVPE